MSVLLWVLLGCAPRAPIADLARPVAPCCTGVTEPRLAQILTAGAASTDVPTRQIALATLVHAAPEPGAGTWGPRGRFDPDEFVQQRVAVALAARRGDPAARDLLRAMALDPRLSAVTRGRAADAALALDPDHAWLDPVWVEPGDEGGRVGLLAVGARWDPALARRLATQLGTAEVPLESGFWDLVAASGSREVAEAVVAVLPRLEPELEVTALAACLPITPDPVGGRLAGILRGDEDAALEVIERVHPDTSPASTALLRDAAAGATGAAARVATLWLLLREDGPEARLTDGLADPDAEVRRVAATVAGELAARGRVPSARLRAALIAAVSSEDPGLQAAAVEAVGRGPDRERLRPLLDDESLELRVRVAAILLVGPPG